MIKKWTKKFSPFLCVMIFASCSTPERRPFEMGECNDTGGYERGYVEGGNGNDPDSNYVERCRDDLRAATRAGYTRGYDKGHAERLTMMAQMRADRLRDQDDAQPAAPPPPQFSC